MSPLTWDLAHIAAYEDLWLCHRHGGRPLLHPELAATYDAFETPRAVRGELPLLDTEGATGYLERVRIFAGLRLARDVA
jgi:iron(II)-dependent oxidoreductase